MLRHFIEAVPTEFGRQAPFQEVAQSDPKLGDDVESATRSNLQGSASLPALRNTEDQVNLKVRETSSWNHPPRESQLDSRKDLKLKFLEPSIIKIGDEGQTEDKYADRNEFVNADMGDACVHQRNKADTDNQGRQKVADSFTVASTYLTSSCHTPYVAASAPTLELDHGHFSDVRLLISDDGTANSSQNGLKTDTSLLQKPQSAGESLGTKNLADGQSSIESPVYIKCQGQLSPNSSLGFIPTVSGDLFDGLESSSSKDQGDYITIDDVEDPNDVPRLDGYRKMIQDEMVTASSLLDDASDVLSAMVAKLDSLEEMQDKALEVKDKKLNSAKKKVSFSEEIQEAVLPAEDYENGDSCGSADSNLGTDVAAEVLDTGFLHLEEGFGHEASKDAIDACPRRERDPRMIRMRQIMDDNQRSDNETRDDAADNCCPRLSMDEAWMRNWYAVHPLLDNIEPSFANGEESKPNFVGETGDQPPNARRGFRRGSGYGRGSRTGSSSESRLASYVSPSYPPNDYKQASFSADEIHPRSGSGRVACNFSFKDSKDNAAMKFSRPYSWNEWAASRLQQARSRDSNHGARSSEVANRDASMVDNPQSSLETADQDLDYATATGDVVVGDSFPISSKCGDAKPDAIEGSISDNSYLGETLVISENGTDSFNDASSDIGSDIASSATDSEAMLEPATNSSPRDHAISLNGEQKVDSLAERLRSLQLNDSREDTGQSEQAPRRVVAGPEKIEPGLDSAGGDFVEGDVGVEEGPAIQEPSADRVIAQDLPMFALGDEEERHNMEGVTVESLEEAKQYIMREEEILSNEFRVLDLQMCSDSEASEAESVGEMEGDGK